MGLYCYSNILISLVLSYYNHISVSQVILSDLSGLSLLCLYLLTKNCSNVSVAHFLLSEKLFTMTLFTYSFTHRVLELCVVRVCGKVFLPLVTWCK